MLERGDVPEKGGGGQSRTGSGRWPHTSPDPPSTARAPRCHPTILPWALLSLFSRTSQNGVLERVPSSCRGARTWGCPTAMGGGGHSRTPCSHAVPLGALHQVDWCWEQQHPQPRGAPLEALAQGSTPKSCTEDQRCRKAAHRESWKREREMWGGRRCWTHWKQKESSREAALHIPP